MKGFIEIELQGSLRLIAINNIAGITNLGDRCKISLHAGLPDFENDMADFINKPAFTQHFETKVGVYLIDVKKLIEDAQ